MASMASLWSMGQCDIRRLYCDRATPYFTCSVQLWLTSGVTTYVREACANLRCREHRTEKRYLCLE